MTQVETVRGPVDTGTAVHGIVSLAGWAVSIVSAHFGERCQHLLHRHVGFIAHGDHYRIVGYLVVLQQDL
jgi:hypothetical protein